MAGTILLFACIILYVAFYEFIKKKASRHIEESNSADEACSYRNKFFIQRLIIAIVFGGIALFIIFFGSNAEVNSIMVGLLLAWTSYQNKHSLPISGKRPHDITKSKFVLYLRGFAYDNYSLGLMDLSRKRKNLNNFSEAHFINVLKQYMPVYAVGMTKELNAPIGAERIYLNDTEWEQEVLDLMNKASLIVILLNDSPSCIWEIRESNLFKNKVVFISHNKEKLANIRQELNKYHVYPLPIGLKDRTISYIIGDNKETQIFEYSDTEKSYIQIVKKLMREKFGLRRLVFTQRKLNLMVGIYAVILFVCWSLLALKFRLDVTTVMFWGIISLVIPMIFLSFVYDKLYALINKSKLRR